MYLYISVWVAIQVLHTSGKEITHVHPDPNLPECTLSVYKL